MELHYKVLGEGHPLIILHGLFGMSDNWFGIARELSDRFRGYLPDLRNHGRSPHSESFTYALMAMDVREFMDRQGLPRAHLMGHSMGGKVAMQLALSEPKRIHNLIVVDIAPRAYPNQMDDLVQVLQKLDLSAVASRREADRLLQKTIGDAALRQFLLKNLKRVSENRLDWKFNLGAIYRNLPELFRAIEGRNPFAGPTLFIKGERSPYVSPADMPAIRKLFPNSKLEEIPGAGHWVHADAPLPFLRVVRDFLCE